MRFPFVFIVVTTLFLSRGFAGGDPEFSIFVPYTGIQYNITSETGLFKDSTLYKFSGSNSYWPPIMRVDFIGDTYRKLDLSGFNTVLFSFIGAGGFSTYTTSLDSAYAHYSTFSAENDSTGEISVITIEGVLLPRLQWGLLIEHNNLLHGIGININHLSIGQDTPGGEIFHARNAAVELGLQYQLVVPYGQRFHWNPSLSYNFFGKSETRGSSIIIDNEFVVKTNEYMSLYAHVGWAKRTIEGQNQDIPTKVFNTVSFKLALAFHNFSIFGDTVGYN